MPRVDGPPRLGLCCVIVLTRKHFYAWQPAGATFGKDGARAVQIMQGAAPRNIS